MFEIRLQTTRYKPAVGKIELRTSVDGWERNPLSGRYDPGLGAWVWELDVVRYAGGFKCKFFASSFGWQGGPDIEFFREGAGTPDVAEGRIHRFSTAPEREGVIFGGPRNPIADSGWVEETLFEAFADEAAVYDVIVIGSGMGGGTVADHLADTGLNVLVLEAGGYQFPTHVGNLPRPHAQPGAFSKHIWAMWDRFKSINYDSGPGSDYIGGQGFNLGGRSVFWGGFMPRMTSWELSQWPTAVKWDLEDIDYLLAEDFMGRSTGPRTLYNRQIHLALRKTFPEMNHADAPVAIRQRPEGANTLATGVFSTADVLMESMLTPGRAGEGNLDLLLNHQAIEVIPDNPAAVVVRDLVRDRVVTLRAREVVIAAGCIESARLVKRSAKLPDPDGLVGKGVSDHPIFFTHFRIPRASAYFDPNGNVKTLSQPKEGADPANRMPFNLLLELGADLNHGRYLDEDIWNAQLAARRDYMLCEIVFLCNEALNETNRVSFEGPDDRPLISIRKYGRQGLKTLTDELKWRLLRELGAQPLTAQIDPAIDEEGWKAALAAGEGMPGGVAHEVGSLRMRLPARDETTTRTADPERPGLVDENLCFVGTPHGNIYVCDLSVFPTTPAANPSLSLVALAIRLSRHLFEKLR